MNSRDVGASRVLDFFAYVLWIEQWIAMNEEANRKMEESQNAT